MGGRGSKSARGTGSGNGAASSSVEEGSKHLTTGATTEPKTPEATYGSSSAAGAIAVTDRSIREAESSLSEANSKLASGSRRGLGRDELSRIKERVTFVQGWGTKVSGQYAREAAKGSPQAAALRVAHDRIKATGEKLSAQFRDLKARNTALRNS